LNKEYSLYDAHFHIIDPHVLIVEILDHEIYG